MDELDLRNRIREWLDQPSQKSYEQELLLACKALSFVQQEIGRRIKPLLNMKIQLTPQATADDKKNLGKWLNGELAKLGLAVKCPRTGMPGQLYGHATHDGLADGSFQFSVTYPDGRRTGTYRTTELSDLDFIPRQDWKEKLSSRAR